MVSNKRYEEMLDFHQKKYDEMHDRFSNRDRGYWNVSHQLRKAERARDELAGKCELYEKLLNKYIDNYKTTDDIFLFEGVPFKPVNYNLVRDTDDIDRLTIEFVECRPDFQSKK